MLTDYCFRSNIEYKLEENTMNKLEIYFSNKRIIRKVNNIDEAYYIVSRILNNPSISEEELNDMRVYYNGDPNIIEMVE